MNGKNLDSQYKYNNLLIHYTVSDLLNPLPSLNTRLPRSRCVSTPIISPTSSHGAPQRHHNYHHNHHQRQREEEEQIQPHTVIGKPRSRFSEAEDNIIRQGVAQRLTWGQISELLPHRKRATCFNRYRTLQGIRKSRKSSTSEASSPEMSTSPSSPVTSCFSGPTTPPTCSIPLNTSTSQHWFSSDDIIYDQPISSKIAAVNYSNDINCSISSDSSSDDNDDFPLPVKRRTHKISLPALIQHRQYHTTSSRPNAYY